MERNRRVIAVYRREEFDHVPWEPRLQHWYNVNKHQGTLPERYRDMSLLDVFDDLGCSVRTYGFFNGCFRYENTGDVESETKTEGNHVVTTTRTPAGTVQTVVYRTELARQIREFPIKTPKDFKVMEYLLRQQRVVFDQERYAEALRTVGDRGAPTVYAPRVSIQRMFINYAGFENTIFLLHDEPAQTEQFLSVINETDDKYFDALLSSPIEVVNFGDNVHSDMLPPPLFEKYVMDYQRSRVDQLHAAGKFCHPHWDGYCRPLLKYVRAMGYDGVEAVTPQPQGDVTLEETKEAFGDEVILIDGIPCTHFLREVSYRELEEFTEKIVDMFAPRLVLGISDELSPPGDIEKVRLVSEIVSGARKNGG